MDHYVELRIRPDPELLASQVLEKVYARLHRELARLGREDIGVSFPQATHQRGLGSVFRLHGSADALAVLLAGGWLESLRDYVASEGVRRIPDDCRYRRVSRAQAKSSPERLRRRQMKRHGIDAATAAARIPDTARESLRLPFVRLTSASTGQQFLLFVSHGPLQNQPTQGRFSAYGLSADGTVPWF
jgi:CRISPR-associated endonuclease Csy4